MGYRVWIFSESPLTPSSIGKTTLLLAAGLAERGHSVAVITYSQAHYPTPTSWRIVFNPRKWATAADDPLAEHMPDADIHIYPWGKLFDIYSLFINAKWRPEAALFYAYPYAELDLNDIAYRYFTSKGSPSVIYALHEGPSLAPDLALSVLAHSVVATPTRFVLEQYMCGVSKFKGEAEEDISQYFYVLPHPTNVDLYSPSAAKTLADSLGLPERCIARDYVVGMFAKNHVRKDYGALIEAVVKARRLTGLDIAAGLYWVDSVSSGHWSLDKLRLRVKSKYGVSDEEFNDIALLLPEMHRAAGLSESMLIYVYSKLMDLHLFLTRGEAFGIPPLESALLGVPTATTDIPPQREIFGNGARYVKSQVVEEDDYSIWRPSVDDATSVIVEFTEGKLPALDAPSLRRFDYRRVAATLESILDAAFQTPRPLSEKINIKVGQE